MTISSRWGIKGWGRLKLGGGSTFRLRTRIRVCEGDSGNPKKAKVLEREE